jgi:hypothetical protein
MAQQRQSLSQILHNALESDEVYFQAPEGKQMSYPAILYSRSDVSVQHGDNLPYRWAKGYELILISRSPDSPISDKLERLPYCRFVRSYKADGLNHSVFLIFH